MNRLPPPRPWTCKEAYAVPRHPAPIDLRLDGNEGQLMLQSLEECLSQLDDNRLREYPSTRDLESKIADKFGLEPTQVLITAGADDGLSRLCRAYLSPQRGMVLPIPTFEMIRRFADSCEAPITPVPWKQPQYPIDDVLDAVEPTTAVIAVVSPNNPTGGYASAADLIRLSEACPSSLLMVDCAYGEFADDDLTKTALTLPNAIVFRTVSKALGLAGLRLGYAMGPAPVIAAMRVAGLPYPVSSPSLVIAEQALFQGGESALNYIDQVRRERKVLLSLCSDLGLSAQPSQGNFVFAQAEDPLWWRDALAGFGISIRAWPKQEGLEQALRITCPGEPAEFKRLSDAMDVVARPQALLFDIDGVLADVSDSYRAAIKATASHFGVEVTDDDIESVKAQGNANNDWQVTETLLVRAECHIAFEEIKREFERRYWGDGTTVGLNLQERFIGLRDRLLALAKTYPLAAVTGRPRRDADEFLMRFELNEVFTAVVVMEDAQIKPSPEPVHLALSRLGVQRAWMLGDTRDDMEAARGAGVLPIGVVPPGCDFTVKQEQLLCSGAARVLSNWMEVESLLS